MIEMMPAGLMVAQALMTEVAFLAAAVWVWRALVRLDVNGPCRLGIGLLVTMRLGRVVSMVAGNVPPLDYAWLAEVVFSFVFVYTIYHVGVLIALCRSRGTTAVDGGGRAWM